MSPSAAVGSPPPDANLEKNATKVPRAMDKALANFSDFTEQDDGETNKTTTEPVGTDCVIPCTEFHRFSKLPAELRITIWKLARPGPRVIRVKVHIVKYHISEHVRGLKFTSFTPVPAVLHACKESRAIALKTYKLGMKTHCDGPRVYVDFTKDTIYMAKVENGLQFRLADLLRDMAKKELTKIRHLAIEKTLWDEDQNNDETLLDLHGLKIFSLIMHLPSSWDACEEVELQDPTDKDAEFYHEMGDGELSEDEQLWRPSEVVADIYEVLEMITSQHPCVKQIPQIQCKLLVAVD